MFNPIKSGGSKFLGEGVRPKGATSSGIQGRKFSSSKDNKINKLYKYIAKREQISKEKMKMLKQITKMDRKMADLEANFNIQTKQHGEDNIKIHKRIANIETIGGGIDENARKIAETKSKTEHHAKKINTMQENIGKNASEISDVKLKSVQDLHDINIKLHDLAMNLTDVPKTAVKEIFSSPDLLSQAVKELDKVIQNKENSAMLKAVLKDSKIQNLLIDFCTSAEDEKLKKEPYLKGLYDRVMDKINPLRPKALVDYPSNLIAGLIVSIIVLSIVYLYNTFTSGELDVRHVDRFKGIDLETLNAPPELKKLIEDNQNINQQITDFQTAVNGMNVYQEYLKELNPVTGHTDWIEKGLDYYNNPENTRYLEKIDSHIKNEDSYFHKIKSMIDLGNLSTDTGKATRGLLAENMRLKALAEKNQNDCEGYDIGLRNSHLQLKKEVMEKLNNKKDSNFINEAQAEELQKKLDKCKDIDNDSFLVIFVKNRKLEKINRDLDKNIYDESAPEGGSLCTIF